MYEFGLAWVSTRPNIPRRAIAHTQQTIHGTITFIIYRLKFSAPSDWSLVDFIFFPAFSGCYNCNAEFFPSLIYLLKHSSWQWTFAFHLFWLSNKRKHLKKKLDTDRWIKIDFIIFSILSPFTVNSNAFPDRTLRVSFCPHPNVQLSFKIAWNRPVSWSQHRWFCMKIYSWTTILIIFFNDVEENS